MFQGWSDWLPPEVEVCAVRLPGREGHFPEPPFTNLSSLIPKLFQVLRPRLSGACALFGHSMGALISFELARHLRREGHLLPAHLFISGHRAPRLPLSTPPIHRLPDAEFLNKLRSLGGSPQKVLENNELMEVLSPTLRADFALCETYSFLEEEELDCPITVFGGEQDETVEYDELLAWRAQTRGAFCLCMLPGNHFFLESNRALFLCSLAHHLRRLL